MNQKEHEPIARCPTCDHVCQASDIVPAPTRAWYDRDNRAIYTNEKDAEFARAGGNDVRDLVERP